MHHEVQIKNKVKYHYLSENIRIGRNKWKKIRLYMGKGNLSEHEIQRTISKTIEQLIANVEEARRLHDPLMSLLAKKEIIELEKIKHEYQKSKQKIPKPVWQNYYEAFITEFTYDTNAIEGSSVTLQETGLILFDRIVPEGKTIIEVREVENHKDAFDFMLNYRGDITKRFVLQLHKKLMHNILWKYAGMFRDVQVAIRGTVILPPPPEKVEKEFKSLMKWYGANKNKYHPAVVVAYFHAAFESIHPFRDGNGRTGRLLLNFILHKKGFPMIDVKNKDRMRYYNSLEEAQKNGNLKPLTKLITGYIKESEMNI
jgi:fido (protein-threonine AMPylation protein)